MVVDVSLSDALQDIHSMQRKGRSIVFFFFGHGVSYTCFVDFNKIGE
jgi:hypothetical protein